MLLAALALMTQSVVEMRHHYRLLVIAAPAETDRQAQQQIAALAAASELLAARDVVIVTVMADRVAGVRDSAAALRQLWSLPRDRFTVLLIGKDGHVALRQTDPITPQP